MFENLLGKKMFVSKPEGILKWIVSKISSDWFQMPFRIFWTPSQIVYMPCHKLYRDRASPLKNRSLNWHKLTTFSCGDDFDRFPWFHFQNLQIVGLENHLKYVFLIWNGQTFCLMAIFLCRHKEKQTVSNKIEANSVLNRKEDRQKCIWWVVKIYISAQSRAASKGD